MKPRTPLSRVEIKIRMLQQGFSSWEQVAQPLGISREAVSRVLWGRDRTPRVRLAICEALGWPESKLWPGLSATHKPRKPYAEQQSATAGEGS